jgi:hypothetical protein
MTSWAVTATLKCSLCNGTGTIDVELNSTQVVKPAEVSYTPSRQVIDDIREFLEVNNGSWYTVVNLADRLGASQGSVRKAVSRLLANTEIKVRPDPDWNSKRSPTPRKQYSLANYDITISESDYDRAINERTTDS